MSIAGFDHVAIPTAQPEAMLNFYRSLGFQAPTMAEWQASGLPFFSIVFADNKINVHAPAFWRDGGFDLRGPSALPGCGDFCFVWAGTLEEIQRLLREVGADLVEGPVQRLGGRGRGTVTGTSVYTRDPDRNLLEFIVYRLAG